MHMIQLKTIQSICLVNGDLNSGRQTENDKWFSAEDICCAVSSEHWNAISCDWGIFIFFKSSTRCEFTWDTFFNAFFENFSSRICRSVHEILLQNALHVFSAVIHGSKKYFPTEISRKAEKIHMRQQNWHKMLWNGDDERERDEKLTFYQNCPKS